MRKKREKGRGASNLKRQRDREISAASEWLTAKKNAKKSVQSTERIRLRTTLKDFKAEEKHEDVSVDDILKGGKDPNSKPWKTRGSTKKILKELVQKYGEDYERMAMDISINIYQLTPNQLRRGITKMNEEEKTASRRREFIAKRKESRMKNNKKEKDVEPATEDV